MIRTLLSLLLLPGLAFAQERGPLLAQKLEAISSEASVLRQEAERWLAAHIEPGDQDSLARAARAGDMEVRRRLARAIGQADRDLRIASSFLASEESELQEVGQSALELSITRWNKDAWRRGIHGQSLGLHLRLLSADSWPQILRIPIMPSLGETCALLEQRAGLPLGLAVAPDVAARKPSPGIPEAFGTWDELVLRLAEIYRVAFDGHGFDPDPGQPKGRVFLRFCQPTDVAQPTSEVLIGWSLVLAGRDNLAARVAAARALASSGWDAALAWLSVRVEEDRDSAALEGVLTAAADGRIARVLGTSDLLSSMVSTAEGDLEQGDKEGRAVRILAAFQHMRSLGPGGEQRAASILAGWDAAGLAGRWLRLAILTEMRSPGACATAAALLSDASTDPLLYRQALKAWIAGSAGIAGAQPPNLAAPASLFGAHADLSSAIHMARSLSLGGFAPPSRWSRPEALPARFDFQDRACVLAWFVLQRNPGASASHWRALLRADELLWREDSQAVSEVLLEIGIAHGSGLHRAWELARAELPKSRSRLALDRSAFLAGLLEPHEELRLWKELEQGFEDQGLDLLALGVISGRNWNSALGYSARTQLLDQLRLALAANLGVEASKQLVEALERSVSEMEMRGWELSLVGLDRGRREMAEQWSEQIGRQAKLAQRSQLGTYFTLQWPADRKAGMRDLEAEARLPIEELRSAKDTPTDGPAFRR